MSTATSQSSSLQQPTDMQTEFRNALADALGSVVAKERETWRREREVAEAEHRHAVAELRQKAAEFELALRDLHAADHVRVAERLASLKDGERGEKGDPGNTGNDGTPGERGPAGERGDKGDPGERGEKGERGERGEAGLNGKDGALGERGNDGAPGEKGVDGLPGETGERGERGLDGPVGKFDAPKEWTRGIHYESALVTHEGETFCARRDTAEMPPHDDWALVAAKGNDAPVGEVCGLFDEAKSYNKFDLVAFSGCEWRAKRDSPGPLPGDGWALSAKQGKRGDKGERGDRGEPGRQGVPGASIAERKIDGFLLIDTMSDGSVHVCDIRPAFELYHGETR